MLRLISAITLIVGCANGLSFAASSDASSGVSSAVRTNVVLIMTDDQGVWSTGCYGNPDAQTPHIDRLAAEGVRMARAFAVTPVCSPSRATFYTGRIPSQHGIHEWIMHENMGPKARYCLENEVTFSEVLARNGYVCGISGKWHVGDNLHPHAGYTYWFAHPSGGGAYNDAKMVWNGKLVKTTGYLTDRITDKAIEFLDTYKSRPFFLNVQYTAPHSPWKEHPQELIDLYRDCAFDSIPKLPMHPWASAYKNHLGNRQSLEQYFASCTGVDRGVGRIMTRLEKLGLSRNTLVIYTSDQGFNFGHHGLVGKGNCTSPKNMYDTSLQIPLIFRHTGHLPTERVIDLTVSVYDFAPTVLDYLGLPTTLGRKLPGRSFAPTLRSQPQPNWPDAICGEYGTVRMIRTARYKYVHRPKGGPLELYDLQKDPGERVNVCDHPAYQEVVVKLRHRMCEWFDRYVDPVSDPVVKEYLPAAGQSSDQQQDKAG